MVGSRGREEERERLDQWWRQEAGGGKSLRDGVVQALWPSRGKTGEAADRRVVFWQVSHLVV